MGKKADQDECKIKEYKRNDVLQQLQSCLKENLEQEYEEYEAILMQQLTKRLIDHI